MVLSSTCVAVLLRLSQRRKRHAPPEPPARAACGARCAIHYMRSSFPACNGEETEAKVRLSIKMSFTKTQPPTRIHESDHSDGLSDWILNDIIIWTQLEFQLNIHSRYSNWSVSEDVKQRARFSRTEKFEELLLVWMRFSS